MNSKFYLRIAFSNLKKNSQTYIPYILMGIFIVTMYFMMSSLYKSDEILHMNEGQNIVLLLGVGMWVIKIFAVIFIFYINSFLIKRRKQEIGLYNILGMEKRHIGKMMYVETIYIMLVDIICGIILGIVFGKLMFIGLFKLIKSSAIPEFALPVDSVMETVVFFLILFSVIFLYNLMKIHLTNPIEMLHGGEIGEKEPKAKIIVTAIGLLTMGWGYYFALMYKKPLSVMNLFMVAVIAVIIGTYCLFTSGSIGIIKLLRKNKKFYYKPNNFSVVSGMLYRMKQNAVGMANICILSTMVLISVSTTVCLYAGMEDTIKVAYPREVNVTSEINNSQQTEIVDNIVNEAKEKYNVKGKKEVSVHNLSLMFRNGEEKVLQLCDGSNYSEIINGNGQLIEFIPLDEFNRESKCDYELEENEVLLYSRNKEQNSHKLSLDINGGKYDFTVKSRLKKVSGLIYDKSMESYMNTSVVIVKDISILDKMNSDVMKNEVGTAYYSYQIFYDTDLSEKDSQEMCREIDSKSSEEINIYTYNQYAMRYEFNQMYGGFLFLGIFVSIIFLMATALIIYYKQISEGFDDRDRFVIMQKVGMSSGEVKKTIKTQVMMVFILPLVVAAVHVAVAFRIFKIILEMLSFSNAGLFGLCTVVTLGIFAVIYMGMFWVTSRSYYKIVSFEA